MRISGGIAKGRRIVSKKLLSEGSGTEPLRPTSSKVREALFDILRDRIIGRSFVDLYAGTGTVGLEALSRGADRAIFVEPDEFRVTAIKKHAEEFGFQKEKVLVFRCRALEFLKRASSERKSFDIFFVDPPYYSEEIDRILPFLGEKRILNEGGTVVAEHFFKKKVPEAAGDLRIYRNYRYGDTVLTLYRKSVNKSDGKVGQ